MLSESLIQDAFHSYLKSSLTQAKLERLIDADVLSRAEGDLMISGPALCLYFAALRCTTNPPSVPLPRSVKSLSNGGTQHLELSINNCPPTFVSFLRVWAQTVPSIQSLTPEHQHDLARIICGLLPLTRPDRSLSGIAADLRAVALEISQRRSFQDRYASDIQAALDAGTSSGSRTAFVPPPVYEPTSPTSSNPPSPRYSTPPKLPPRPGSSLSVASSSSYRSYPTRTPSPTIFTPNSPAIEFIRETLYAALGGAIEQNPSLKMLLRTDPPRAYFASVSLAILSVATTSVDLSTNVIRGVLGTPLTLEQCPPELRPLMSGLIGIGRDAHGMAESDDNAAVNALQRGEEVPIETRMERVKKVLLKGVGYDLGSSDDDYAEQRSIEGRAVNFANEIGALAVGMTRLSAFRERQDMVFEILKGVGPSW